MNAIAFLSDQPWVEQPGWTLVHFLWQGAAIAGLYAIARGWLIRFAGPQARYGLACTVLAVMLIAPVVTFVTIMAAGESKPAQAACLWSQSLRQLSKLEGRIVPRWNRVNPLRK